ncbi:MAG TPA: cytidylate kinase-like family protein [Thermoanaerobaculia bacterium]|nr:cytidylate kinase-like family protein [Thermoanaerobaculia bacterium]HQN06036.1 cytidylate kinase-like family protein [Thermoanaerobaculia bacterium]HQP88343.1 cytidylate kinase-like family protein [Thermoanaerobaculia bacterium]
MSFVSSEEKTLAFVAAQLGASPKGPPRSREKRRPLVTVSRETGAGGNTFGEALCGWLEENQPKGRGPWVLVDRELVDKILEDDALPDRLASWSPEDHLAGVSFVIEELLGLHRAAWKPMQETTETILRLGEMGNVVLVGRGANVILGHLPQAFHVRLVASLESRVENVAAARELSKKAACAWVEAEDKARRRFIRRYFQVDVADPLLYNLVVNVDRVPIEEAARVVGEAVLARAERGG